MEKGEGSICDLPFAIRNLSCLLSVCFSDKIEANFDTFPV